MSSTATPWARTRSITKPVTHTGLIDVIHSLTKYWLEVVELPDETVPEE
jgi:hypothetical protein